MTRLRRGAVALSITAAAGLLPAASAFAAGSISGTATAAGSGAPVAGLSVCADANFVGGVSSGCTRTDAAGRYTIGGLAARSDYQVEFSSFGDLNFLTQYYKGKEGLNNWDPVTVNEGATTAGIDAVMNPGAQISGRATEQGTGAAAAEVQVCVLDPAPNPRAEEFKRCADTDRTGNYAVRSLPAGTYIVVFAPEKGLIDPVPFAQQYYANAAGKPTATQISIAPPETKTGIDASLVNRLQTTLTRAKGFRTVTRHRRARVGFRFSAPGPVDGFICKRDGGPWRTCRMPQRFWAPLGRHTFRVRAIGFDGIKGPVAMERFRVTLSPGAKRAGR